MLKDKFIYSIMTNGIWNMLSKMTVLCLFLGISCAPFAVCADHVLNSKYEEMSKLYKNNQKWKAIKKQRKIFAVKKRRIIFNNDGDDYRVLMSSGKDAFLEKRTKALMNTPVDSIFYCIGCPFTKVNYKSKIAELRHPGLMNLKKDAIQILIEFCKKNKKEIICSFRMNDLHDYSHSEHEQSNFKKDHPEYLSGTKRNPPPDSGGRYTWVNYQADGVRERLFSVIQEICQNYDVDGIELDFFRNPMLFKNVAWGADATKKEMNIMTELLQKIRYMTEQEGIKRGRAFLISIRIPDSVDYCKAMGINIEEWLKQGLFDIMVVSGRFRMNNWDYSINLGRKHGVMVYPCISESRVGGNWLTSGLRCKAQTMYGRAMTILKKGANGIYTFNWFNPRWRRWKIIGSLDTLEGESKVYYQTVCNGNPELYLKNSKKYQKRLILTPDNPLRLYPDKPVNINLYIADNFKEMVKQGKKPRITCNIEIDKLKTANDIIVSVNGHLLKALSKNGMMLTYSINHSMLKIGNNKFTISKKKQNNKNDDDLNFIYDASQMPKKPLTLFQYSIRMTPKTSAKIIDNALYMMDDNSGRGKIISYRYFWNILPEAKTKIEFELKLIRGKVYIFFANGQNIEMLSIYKNRAISRFSKKDCPLKESNVFNKYIIEFKNNDFSVYRNGDKIINGVGDFTNQTNKNLFKIGVSDLGAGKKGEILLKNLRISSSIKFNNIYDLYVEVKYD
jgi:hypothetical protein